MATPRLPCLQPGWGIFSALPVRSSSQPPDVDLSIAARLPLAQDVGGGPDAFRPYPHVRQRARVKFSEYRGG
jgi:hypothetical protein